MKTNDDIAAYYSSLLAEHGPTHRAGDHGSVGSRAQRLHAILGLYPDHEQMPSATLDVGCGVGDLYPLLPWWTQYEGWDLSADLTKAAGARWDGPFLVRDLFASTETGAFDYVVASGLFQFADPLQARHGIDRMWALARKAVAFNFLTKTDDTPGETRHDPLSMLAFCQLLTPRVVLRMDYLPNDATIYMYR